MRLSDTLHLFPTPVLTYELGRTLTEKEIGYIDGVSTMDNIGNRTSQTGDVLDAPEMQVLKTELTTMVSDAFHIIHSPSSACDLYITQSWLNYTSKGEYHHNHFHRNSLYSAVLYLRTAMGDTIDFTQSHTIHQQLFDFNPKSHNAFNSRTFRLPVHDYMVVFFPSYLMHEVAKVNHNETRTSLAFNTFIKGELGEPHKRNNLIL